MAKVEMTAAVEEEPKAPAATAQTAVVVRQNQSPSVFVESDDAEGEFTQDDQVRSYLSIVAKTGKMADLFTPGDLLVNQEFVIGGTKSPIEFVPIKIVKRYQNDVKFDPEEPADVVNSAVEVLNRGGLVEYRPYDDDESTQYWKPILQALLLIKRPANVPPDAAMLFPYEIDGVDYGVVGYTARTKTAYNGFAKPLINVKMAKGTVRGFNYRLSTKGESWHDPKSGQDKSWIAISARSIGAVSEAIQKFLTENYSR